MSTLNIQSLCRNLKRFPKIIAICFLNWFLINPQWLELPMSRTNFHGPKDVRAIEVRLYIEHFTTKIGKFSDKKILTFFIFLLKT